jgi:hypothetical protein
MLLSVIEESQSEVKLLREELMGKTEQIVQNEAAQLAQDLAALDPNSTERQVLMQVLNPGVGGFKF